MVLAVIAATASACGGSGSGSLGGNAIAKTDDGSITFGANGDRTDITGTDAQGNDFSVSGGTDVPADFPLPVPDNVDISSATTFDMPEGRSFGLIFDFDGSRAAEITKLYRDALNVIVSINDFGDYWEASLSWTPA